MRSFCREIEPTKFSSSGAGRLDFQRRREFGRELRRVGEGELLGIGLDEEIERVEHGEIGQKIDLDAELRRSFR